MDRPCVCSCGGQPKVTYWAGRWLVYCDECYEDTPEQAGVAGSGETKEAAIQAWDESLEDRCDLCGAEIDLGVRIDRVVGGRRQEFVLDCGCEQEIAALDQEIDDADAERGCAALEDRGVG